MKAKRDHVHGKIAAKRRGVPQAENWKEITSQFSYREWGKKTTTTTSPSIVVSYYMHVGTYLHCRLSGWLTGCGLSQSGLVSLFRRFTFEEEWHWMSIFAVTKRFGENYNPTDDASIKTVDQISIASSPSLSEEGYSNCRFKSGILQLICNWINLPFRICRWMRWSCRIYSSCNDNWWWLWWCLRGGGTWINYWGRVIPFHSHLPTPPDYTSYLH